MEPERSTTIQYYENNAERLARIYQSVKFEFLQKELLRFFDGKHNLLEIGSGSGRDAAFFMNHGFDVTGLDGSEEMVNKSIEIFPVLNGRIICAELPANLPSFDHDFDAIISIATLMHFNEEDLSQILKFCHDNLHSDGKIFISVPAPGELVKDGPFVNNFNEEKWLSVFQENQFITINKTVTQDGMGRQRIWYNFYLKKV